MRTGWSSWPTGKWWANSSSRPPTPSWSGCGRWGPDMWNVTIKGLLARKLRLGLTALAIVLGVTFVSGTLVLTDTLNRTFDALVGNVYGKIDFEIRGQATLAGIQTAADSTTNRKPVPQSIAAAVGRVPGVEY